MAQESVNTSDSSQPLTKKSTHFILSQVWKKLKIIPFIFAYVREKNQPSAQTIPYNHTYSYMGNHKYAKLKFEY